MNHTHWRQIWGITLAIATLNLIFACRQEAYKKLAIPLSLNKEREFRLDSVVMGEPSLARTDDPDTLYVSSRGKTGDKYEVYRLGPDLEVRGKYTIRRGQGPGESLSPRIYGGDELSILVYDLPGNRFIEFDRDFKPIKEIRTKNRGIVLPNAHGYRYIAGKRLVIDGYYQLSGFYRRIVHLYSLKLTDQIFTEDTPIFKMDYSWRKSENNKIIWAFPLHFVYSNNHVYILDKQEYRLEKIDLNGKVLVDKRIPFTSRSVDKDTRKRWIEAEFPNDPRTLQSYDYPDDIWPVSWLLPLGNGIAVARCDSYDPDIEPGPITADYFDADLNLLGQVQLPYFPNWNSPSYGHSLVDKSMFYRDGKLYMLEERDEDWLLIRYGVKIGEIERQTGEKNGD